MQDRYHQLVEVLLRRTAGPYICATSCREQVQQTASLFDHIIGAGEE